MSYLIVGLAGLGAVVVALVVTGIVAQRQGRVAVIDATWPLLFVLIAWASLAADEGSARSWLLAVLTTVWGGRLAWHLVGRLRGAGEDPRYEEMLSKVPPERRLALAVRKVFLTQGAVAWFVGLPLMVAATTDHDLGLVAALGVLVWLVGILFEAIGDAQLKSFKADPANKGKIMDRGLWAWTRHPNYFGDACVWWGLFLIAAGAWPGVLTVLSPLAMTLLLAFGSGARLLERSMAQRPGYPEYMERTSMFVPLPPKRS
ncbi:DUF1295 domain-containing protein [Janibacter cremeus]|uniref:Steroid 5-alpha reductase family enzyme n=1 Tax=Janibacter cremeus TaxID=1285192 RepID=A0A852VSZ9_9MICO|nr:DUF1295 domain-containing protein [Janibacter cremeus]NYF96945.1 steroid 5-alpha reductase family enzyme [Janibacter cremeus]